MKVFRCQKDKEIFRILPPLPGHEYVDTAHFHVVKINGKYVKIYCPKHNDARTPKLDAAGQPILDQNGKPILVQSPCPLCAKADALLATQDKSILKIKKEDLTPAQLKIKESNDVIYKNAMQYAAQKFYIIRGVDRGATKDGVKFWRFKYNRKKQGIYDKLIPALSGFVDETGVNFTDVQKGVDVIINVVDNVTPAGAKYRDVSSIQCARTQNALHEDPVQIQKWIDDKTTWKDVFKPKMAPNITSVQYLELAAQGNAPYWDDADPQNKMWIFPNNPELQAKANTRDRDNSSSEEDDYDEDNVPAMNKFANIEQITKADVGVNRDNSIDVSSSLKTQTSKASIEELDDLPF
ncbi:MAG: hypothetical protein HC836_50040 [Richelia sp. RM2_1_2]|nr:hypothetical protein [Richelia sp. RM2_1_2]